jgi:hypothetical protein
MVTNAVDVVRTERDGMGRPTGRFGWPFVEIFIFVACWALFLSLVLAKWRSNDPKSEGRREERGEDHALRKK